LESEGRSAGLKGFEIVKMVHLSPNPFSVENGLQTPSFKLKRSELKKKFTEEIKQMYSLLKS
jgi:long-chain acyl-CoA synthetase